MRVPWQHLIPERTVPSLRDLREEAQTRGQMIMTAEC